MKPLLLLFCLSLSLSLPAFSQVFTSSNLPIVIINTDNSSSIPDEPGVLGTMKIIYKGPGQRNYVGDQDTAAYLNYNGRVDIEIRGSYSQVFPKKAYGFTTLMADNTTNNNVSLLGMPSENDWILNGLSSDPSLIRDYLSYNLSRRLGVYASRTAYCEVMINGIYKGLYVLQEKIKSDGDRVDVIKISTSNNSGPDLTGGYITKADKITGGDPIAWTMSSYLGSNDVGFIHDLPDPDDVTSQQNNYIKSVFESLKTTAQANNSSVSSGYPAVIDIPSFIDFMLINELASNADAYQYSTFFHKDRNGKLRAGPLWDLNLTYGNDLFELGYDRSKPDVWQFANGSNVGPKFWTDLFNSSPYKCHLSKRWHEQTQPGKPLNLGSILDFIDTTVAYISEAVVREDALWGTVGNHAFHINSIKTFVYNRITWMNNHIGPYSGCIGLVTPPLVISKINYHPSTSVSFPSSEAQEFIEITNAGAGLVDLSGVYFSGTGFVYQFPSGASLAPGNAVKLCSNMTTFQARYNQPAYGQFTRNLSNSNYNIVLADGFGNVIDQVHYDDDAPWPDADGNGNYLQLIDLALDNSLAASWFAADENTLSTDIQETKPGLILYPNPVLTTLTLSANMLIDFLEITDVQGRLIQKITIDSDHLDMDMSHYAKGIYIAKVTTQSGTLIRKIVKE